MAKVLIQIKGGIVQWAISDEPVEMIVIDSDVDGTPNDELSEWADKDGDKAYANIYAEDVSVNAELLTNIENSIE